MFNKSLFKQSCKANGTMWIIITVAVCFMLSCVMLIAGDDTLSQTKVQIQDTIIESELTAQTKSRVVTYFNQANGALTQFDKDYKEKYNSLDDATEINEAHNIAFSYAYKNLNDHIDVVIEEQGIDPLSRDALELRGCVLAVLNNNGQFNSFYTSVGEETPSYDYDSILEDADEVRRTKRLNYVMKNSSIFLASNMVKDGNIEFILSELDKYGVTKEKYKEFGFDKYENVHKLASAELVNIRANFDYRMANIQEGETEESIIKELTDNTGTSLLGSLPKEVSDAIEEIGQADLYGILVGAIFFKMAGLLLPIIYLIMTANALIAGQVDSGSMAYILSSSVKRRTVTFTQAIYLVGSLFVMFVCTSITSCICLAIVNVETSLTYGKILLINLGAFIVMFAMSGICFLCSCWFNRSKHSMALGGGLNMFFLVATMLGLFGSEVIPSIVRMKALNMFNYVSIISLFDVVSIIEGGFDYLWKLAILIVIGVICYAVGSEKFVRKDLPL